MLQKIQNFDSENNHLPLKAAGAFIGAALGTVVILVALSMFEEEEYEFEAEEPAEE